MPENKVAEQEATEREARLAELREWARGQQYLYPNREHSSLLAWAVAEIESQDSIRAELVAELDLAARFAHIGARDRPGAYLHQSKFDECNVGKCPEWRAIIKRAKGDA